MKVSFEVGSRFCKVSMAILLGILWVGFPIAVSAQAVTQGYKSDKPLDVGTIVLLSLKDPKKVEAVTQETATRTHGVVVGANDSPVTISGDGQQTFVATVGRYEVLVSNQNGAVTSGSTVSVSSLAGIGMKTSDQDDVIIGKALSSFDGKTGVLSRAQATLSNKSKKELAIGKVIVDISVAHNPNKKNADKGIPSILMQTGSNIAGRPINVVRVYIGIAVLAATFVVAISIIYAGVRNAFIAVGRNPLSRKAIWRSMIQVALISLIIFVSGVFGVYLILRL